MKGRDFMNIFTEKKDFIGKYDKGTEEQSLQSIFALASHIRTNLGKQSYLIDYYLSTFFNVAKQLTGFHATEDGFESACTYQRLCLDSIKPEDKNHSLYQKSLPLRIKELTFETQQELDTKINLRYIALADEFLDDAINHYIAKQKSSLVGIFDEIELRNLYDQISQIIGESLMENLNLKLKQKFLSPPIILSFKHGYMNDLLYRLSYRDIETSKQVFQLVLDSLSSNQ